MRTTVLLARYSKPGTQFGIVSCGMCLNAEPVGVGDVVSYFM